MIRRNRLLEILKDIGFINYRPSKDLLLQLGVTNRRFMKIIRNDGKRELTVSEKENIEVWLSRITNKPVSEIKLMVDEDPSPLGAKNQLVSKV